HALDTLETFTTAMNIACDTHIFAFNEQQPTLRDAVPADVPDNTESLPSSSQQSDLPSRDAPPHLSPLLPPPPPSSAHSLAGPSPPSPSPVDILPQPSPTPDAASPTQHSLPAQSLTASLHSFPSPTPPPRVSQRIASRQPVVNAPLPTSNPIAAHITTRSGRLSQRRIAPDYVPTSP
ncbi:hypothetical protein JCM5353_003966, partial [Sporobolomyces roseus]